MGDIRDSFEKEHRLGKPLRDCKAEVRALRTSIKTIHDLANLGVNSPSEALASIYDLTTAINRDI